MPLCRRNGRPNIFGNIRGNMGSSIFGIPKESSKDACGQPMRASLSGKFDKNRKVRPYKSFLSFNLPCQQNLIFRRVNSN